MSVVAVLALGFFVGLRHATDVDHVVAVTALASRERAFGRTLILGALWGVGHTVTLMLAGGVIILFGLAVPARFGLSLELGVAVMLVVLGLMNLSGTAHAAKAPHPRAWLVRPVLVGSVHGLAGSAALGLLVLTAIREPAGALAYLAFFGAGTIAGMALLTATLIVPLAAAARRFESADRQLARVFGLVSIAVGISIGYRIGIVDGLFLGGAALASQ